jgi:hypothetical protein
VYFVWFRKRRRWAFPALSTLHPEVLESKTKFDVSLKLFSRKIKKTKHMKMAVFWVVTPCSLVEVYLRFRGA